MVDLFVGGIILIIVPLLSLSADQMAKIRVELQAERSVEAHHIEVIPMDLLHELIIPQMHEVGYNSTTSIMFLFTSTQQLATTLPLFEALVMCHYNHIFHLLTIDETHLYAQHGRSFQESLRVLTHIFFTVIFQASIGILSSLL